MIAIPNVLPDSTAPTQVATIKKELDEFGITDKIISICYDTAPVNTGWEGGVGVLLEKELDRKLLKFPCRYHFHELVINEVYKKLFGATSGPLVVGTSDFANVWQKQKLGSCLPASALNDEDAFELIDSFTDSNGGRLEEILDQEFARDDYKELIQLSLTFLGKLVPRSLKPIGPVSNARWMGKLIFGFKQYLLRNHIDLQDTILEKLRLFLCFAVKLYVLPFLKSPLAIKSVKNDIDWMKELHREITPEDLQAPSTRAKRGPKPKNKTGVATVETVTAPRKRGRKPKNKTGVAFVKTVTTRRKRGPKPKNKTDTVETVTTCAKSCATPMNKATETNTEETVEANFSTISQLARIALDKLLDHTWFLHEENVAFAFFDDRIPDYERKEMVENLKREKHQFTIKKWETCD